MDPNASPEHAVLAELDCSWGDTAADSTRAVVVHASRDVWILEAADPMIALPAAGTQVRLIDESGQRTGRVAEHGRNGRFLVSLGDRAVRRVVRLRVSLPGVLRASALDGPRQVEIIDLTTAGCRIRGVELPVGTQVAVDFTPPSRDEAVSVRGVVAHGTHRAAQPWIGIRFRLVALRGGRESAR
jgi:hypothetical protein